MSKLTRKKKEFILKLEKGKQNKWKKRKCEERMRERNRRKDGPC
jgi:hypothetical protein